MNELRVGLNDEASRVNAQSWVWNVPRIMTAYHDPILHASFIRAALLPELLYDDLEQLKRGFSDSMNAAVSEELRQSAMVAGEHKVSFLAGKYPFLFNALINEFIDPVIALWGGEIATATAFLESAHIITATERDGVISASTSGT
jgi:hypothetical protein